MTKFQLLLYYFTLFSHKMKCLFLTIIKIYGPKSQDDRVFTELMIGIKKMTGF